MKHYVPVYIIALILLYFSITLYKLRGILGKSMQILFLDNFFQVTKVGYWNYFYLSITGATQGLCLKNTILNVYDSFIQVFMYKHQTNFPPHTFSNYFIKQNKYLTKNAEHYSIHRAKKTIFRSIYTRNCKAKKHGCLKRLFINFFDKNIIIYFTESGKPSAINQKC